MSSWNQYNNGDEDSEDEEFDYFVGREAIIFMIDANMYNKIDEFESTLEIIQKSLLSGLLTRGKDLIGIIFVNTEHSPDPKDITRMKNIVISPNTSVLLPLCELSKEIMKYFLNFNTPDYFDFGNKYGIKNGSIANALRLCTNMFKQCGYKLSTQTIIYFTSIDKPYPEGSTEFQKCMQKAKDLDETDIQFEILHMSDNFDYKNFFQEFLCMVRHIDSDQFVEPDREEIIKMITNRNLQQNSKKRCNYHLKWILGNSIQVSVSLYNYFKKKVQPKTVKLLRSDNNIIDVKKVYKTKVIEPMDNDENESIIKFNTEENLKPSDTRKVLTVGGEKISFTCEQVSRMRSPLGPGIRLLGFKKRDSISDDYFIKTSAFLYPDENIINGSTKLFRTLWEKCIERNEVPICVIVARRKTTPRFVALIPTESSNSHYDHDGFRVNFLPFENEYRSLNLQGYIKPNLEDDGINIFEKIASKLKIKFSPDVLKDPYLEILEANIIGSAFDIEYEGLGEGCSANVEEQDQRIEKIVDQLAAQFGEELEVAKKRRNDNAGEKATKVAKITDECPSKECIEQLISKNELNVLTIKQLKAYLQQNSVQGLSTTKPKLIEKVIELHS